MEEFDESAEDGLDFMVDVEGFLGVHTITSLLHPMGKHNLNSLTSPFVQGGDPNWDCPPELYDEGLNLGRVYQAMISPSAFSFMTKATMTLTT